jgi:hypothetical protein
MVAWSREAFWAALRVEVHLTSKIVIRIIGFFL